MKLSENILMAAKNLKNNKVRSLLTMLGVIIGVAAVIVMVSLGEGAKKQITDSISAMGSNLLIVNAGRGGMRGGGHATSEPLTNKIIEVITKGSSHIERIAPRLQKSKLVKYGEISLRTRIVGCTTSFPAVRNYQIAQGDFFSEADLSGRRRVAVIGAYIAEELYSGANPVGLELKIGKMRLKVIGVLAEKGQSNFGNSDDLVLIPLTTAQRRLFGTTTLSDISVQVSRAEAMEQVNRELEEALLAELQDETKFRVRNQAELLSTVEGTTQTFTFLLAGIAAVSLLVGGIGIMNIMLVSVTERIREIGIRKAIGAGQEEILGLFLLEAIMLSLAGGIIGVILGCLVAKLVASFSGLMTVLTMPSIVLSFLFSVMIGLFFGVYPAYKAAGLDPIEALRHE